MKIALFCLTLCLFVQSEPTKEETIQWLRENLPVKAAYSGQFRGSKVDSRVVEVAFDGCACTLTTVQTMARSVTTDKFRFSFAGIEKVGMQELPSEPTEYRLTLSASTPAIEDANEREDVFGRHQSKTLSPSLPIHFGDRETADRFAKAFRRMIAACRAEKKEPF